MSAYNPKDDPERPALEIYKQVVPTWDGNTPPQQWLINRIKNEIEIGNPDADWIEKAKRDHRNWERSLPNESRRP